MFKIDENYSDYYKTDPVKYPGGGAINSSGVDTTDGTPWLAKMFDNCVGWMQNLYIKAFGSLTGISNEAENAQTSDVVRALDKIMGDNNAAERTISENTYFKKAGGTIGGDTTVDGKLHVKGDLFVDGIGEEIISTELKVGADTITLRDKNPTGLMPSELAGVVTHNYDGNGNNNIIAVDANGNARVGDIDIATRVLYSNNGTNFFEDEDLTIPATIGQDEIVRDTGNQTSGGIEIYEGSTFSNDDTEAIATRADESAMVDGYGVTWNAQKKRLETSFIPSGAVIPQNIQTDTTITGIVADKCLYITAANAITLTLANASQVGIKIRIINTTGLTHTLSLTSVSINVPHILPMANIEIMWNGVAWQHVGGCTVGETFEQKPQCDSPFDVFPCSSWIELISHNGAFYRSANAPTTLYTLDAVNFYADVERLNPVDWSGIKNADGTPGTVTNTGNTQYNSRGELMKIYAGSWTGTGNAAGYVKKTDDLIKQSDLVKSHIHPIGDGNTGASNANISIENLNAQDAAVSINDPGHTHSYIHAYGGAPYEGYPLSGGAGFYWGSDTYGTSKEGTGITAQHYHTHGVSQTAHSHTIPANTASNDANAIENRPQNYTNIIWKRIA